MRVSFWVLIAVLEGAANTNKETQKRLKRNEYTIKRTKRPST